MSQAIINLETLTCPSCLQKIEGALKNVQGIVTESIKVLFNASKVKLEFDADQVSIEEIEQAIEALGYGVIKSSVRS